MWTLSAQQLLCRVRPLLVHVPDLLQEHWRHEHVLSNA